jgi:uncharacterized protein
MIKRVLPADLLAPYQRLVDILDGYGSLAVAYSGGVDSGLLAYVAWTALGDRMMAVLGESASLARREREAGIEFLETNGIPYRVISTGEMADPDYRKNHQDRCYFCKAELFARLADVTRELGFSHMAHGANTDDLGDHRPGAVAALEGGVMTPLVDAGLGKDLIRRIARALGLSLWDKPAAPCLASRIPYFQEVSREKLAQVEAAEYVLKDLGFPVCRVRHHGHQARIEIPLGDQDRIRRNDIWARVVDGITRAGFRAVAIEEDGFRSGRLNDALS